MERREQNGSFSQTVLNQFLDLFVIPEMRRREETGKLTKPFELRAAQIIFFPDGKKPEIRINSEVRAIGKMKLKSGVSKNKGDPVFENEVEGLNQIYLTDSEDPDCGHATIVRWSNTWVMAFDFRYNKGLALRHIDIAKQFCKAAESSFNLENWAACIDNLFSAAELAAKATLLLMPDPKFRKRATHGGIHLRYNRFADLGNVEPRYREALNTLFGLRSRARYVQGNVKFSETEIRTLLDTVKEMIEDSSTRVQPMK